MDKVYLLKKREYLENRIICAFDDKEYANKIAKRYDAIVESWEVISKLNGEDDTFFFVRLDKEGNIKELREVKSVYEMYTGFDTCNNFYTFVLAKDKDRAVEIANEKRMHMISEGKWPKELEDWGEW